MCDRSWDLNGPYICSKSLWNQPAPFIWGCGGLVFSLWCSCLDCMGSHCPALPPPRSALLPMGLSPSLLPPSWALSGYLPAPVCLKLSLPDSLPLQCPHPHTVAFAAAAFLSSSVSLSTLEPPCGFALKRFLCSQSVSISACLSQPFCPILGLSLPLCPHPCLSPSVSASPCLCGSPSVSVSPSAPLQSLRLSWSWCGLRGAWPAPLPPAHKSSVAPRNLQGLCAWECAWAEAWS